MATVPSKLGPHFQAIPSWAPALWSELAARLSRPLYAKIVIPPEQNPFHPNVRIIGRAYIGDGDATEQAYINQAVTDGAAKRAAGDYLDACWPQYSRAPYVYAWEGPNEPPVQTIQQCHRLNRFLHHWSILMHNRGKRTIGGSISVGRPEGKTDILDLKDAVRACDDWSVHEYGAPTMQTGQGSLCLRYRTHILEPLASIGITPSLYITETGIDGGVIDQAHARQGWKRFCSEDQMFSQLQWYDSEIRKDPAVVAAFPFTSGNQGWPSFEVGESLSRKLAAYILETETMPAPLPQPTNDVQLVQRIVAEAQKHVLPLVMRVVEDPTAPALYRKLRELHVSPQSKEQDVTIGGVTYRFLVGRRTYPHGWPMRGQVLVYAKHGDWGNVKVVEAEHD